MHAYHFLLAAVAAMTSAQTPPGFSPDSDILLPASYGSLSITPGMPIPLNATIDSPIVKAPTQPSLLIMLDLDAPYPQNASYAPFLHWLGATSNASSPVPYVSPAPPSDSAAHRYVLLSYAFPASYNSTSFTMPAGFEQVGTTVESRIKFDLAGFLKGAGLGNVEAANWFLTGPEKNATATGTTTGTGTQATSSLMPFEGNAVRISIGRGVMVAAALVAMLI